jgi:Zn-dependent protease
LRAARAPARFAPPVLDEAHVFGRRLVLFQIFGFRIQIDPSWVVLAFLIVWSLATGAFPALYTDLDPGTYWAMAVAAALGLFASLILHELSHSLVARRYGLAIRGITLFIFGGVAEMEEEPRDARTEFNMAIAGPIASLVLALLFYLFAVLFAALEWPEPVVGTAEYLAVINTALALFNLLPAFPLDGGRVLRAWLWRRSGDVHHATRIAANGGKLLGLGLIVAGFGAILVGDTLAGVWWALIGFFLRTAADAAYTQLLALRLFEGEPISRFATRTPVVAPPDLSIQSLVEDYIYGFRHEMFPVVDGAKLIGQVGLRDVQSVPRARWGITPIAEIMRPLTPENTVSPDTDAVRVLALMRRSGNHRLMLAQQGELFGVVTLKDLLRFFDLKLGLDKRS